MLESLHNKLVPFGVDETHLEIGQVRQTYLSEGGVQNIWAAKMSRAKAEQGKAQQHQNSTG